MRQYTYSFKSDWTELTITTPEGAQHAKSITIDPDNPGIIEEEEVQQAIQDLILEEFDTNGVTHLLVQRITDLAFARLDSV